MVHRNLRILFLLLVLLGVAGMTFAERQWVRGWSRPLAVDIYPIAADDAGAAYIARLKPDDFQEIATWLSEQGARWRGQPVPPLHFKLKPPLQKLPPLEPARSTWEAIRQSLRLRWYAFRNTPFWASLGTVRLFVLFHEPKPGVALPDSHGLQKGLVGIVNVFAHDAQRAQNHIVFAHELLHTLGASDKYNSAGQPIYPVGYGDFTANPRYPQSKAEIMAGRVALSTTQSEMPRNLDHTVIGYATAAEIGW